MNKQDLLLEIGAEEMPASAVYAGIGQLKEKADEFLRRERLVFESLVSTGGPRRLTLLVRGLAEYQEKSVSEVRGPAKRAAYDDDGKPTAAAKGFAGSQGVSVDSLVTKEIKNGEYVFAVKEEPGLPASEVLPRLLPELIQSLSFRKSMRWGDSRLRFVRPIRWLVAMHGDQVVRFELDGVQSGNQSMGHRWLAENPVAITGPERYEETLKKANVIADNDRRAEIIRARINSAARSAGGHPVVNNAVFREVVQLVELPDALIGSFPEEFLTIPRDVLVTAMEAHQRYFPVQNAEGQLIPRFVLVHNGDPDCGELISKGHERVLKARLADAKFFFEEDRKRPLSDYVSKLKGVVFQEQLGTVFDKVESLQNLVSVIAERLNLPAKTARFAERTAYLCKADLVTEMVGEFPTLQGIMGREYASLSGEPVEVAKGIDEHYLPRSAADNLPGTIAGSVVSVADKLDTVAGSLAVGLIPTGSEDPYALRRQASGLVAIILNGEWRLSLDALIDTALELYEGQGVALERSEAAPLIKKFLVGRLKAQAITKGIPADVIDAVLAVASGDPVDTFTRAGILAEWKKTGAISDILTAFNRCKNLSKPELGLEVEPELLHEAAERRLEKAVAAAENELESAIKEGDYNLGLEALVKLKPAIDAFFDGVMVMVKDKGLQKNRLKLINRTTSVFLRLARFSDIVYE